MKKRHLNITLLLSFILLSLISCKNKTASERNISVSILPQKYFIERIAGDYVHVNVMIPPGMNPATCDLSTGQLKKLYDSDIYFAVGYLPFEITHLYPVLESRKEIRLVNHSDNIRLVEGSCSHHGDHHHEGGYDPHIWMSPVYAKVMSQTILDVLAEKYPEQKETFTRNYKLLEQDIDSVARKAGQTLSAKAHKTFLIYHPALTYFAQDYGMEQISIEEEGKEPHPAHLKKIIDEIKEKDIRIIFIQNQFDVNNAKAIGNETGTKIIQIDPLNENWLDEMNSLVDILEKELN